MQCALIALKHTLRFVLVLHLIMVMFPIGNLSELVMEDYLPCR